jgi:subtilisin family serine protease
LRTPNGKRWRGAALASGLLVASTFTATGASAAQDDRLHVPEDVAAAIAAEKAEATYLVQMAEDPAIAYEGGTANLPATAPQRGAKYDPTSRAAQRYEAHLQARHDRAMRDVGALAEAKLYDYDVSFNGFAARLTGAQAAALEARDDVLAVWKDEVRHLTTDNSPDFLGLNAEGGLWADHGLKGEDVIVGVIDTGIWPEHPSFADTRSGTSAYDPPTEWYGICETGEQFSKSACNDKLIGGRYFRRGAGASGVITDDYLSPRDRDGHGTHTASTAAGNAGVEASILGGDLGTVTGIAPRARVAAYKVCWNNLGCYLSDILAAIDYSVSDGVDVVNYSIGGGATLAGPDDIAYLYAADAGVHVATSAGNSGPGAETMGGPASVPWITAVGASTQDRTFQGSVVLGNSAEYTGASVTGGTAALPLVDSEDAGSELCIPGDLDPDLVQGKIVLCLRGAIARVDKSYAVHLAGGAGMVLYNPDDVQALVTDNHWVPSVHVNLTTGQAVKDYIDTAGASAVASIVGGQKVTVDAPYMADFSSRGPNPAAYDIIKPDVTAPGVNILAGASPNPYLGAPGQLFQAISGTSMSSPHVAGIFALLKEAQPDWSAAAMKSAIMTTAHQDVEKEGGTTPADPFDMGAGHVAPNGAIDPGLVYEAGFLDYVAFLCGASSAVGQSTCDYLEGQGYSFDASDLNLPSIGIADLAGYQTVTRTVTADTAGTYAATVEAPAGVNVAVTPQEVTLDAGGSAEVAITFTVTDATLGEWAFGALTWSDGTREARSPIAVRPVAIAAPDEVAGEGTTGSLSFDVTFGYTGDYSAAMHGLQAANEIAGTVVDDPANDINTALTTGDGVTYHFVDVPSGTTYARWSLFDDYTDGNDDLDLYVFGPDSAGYPFVGGSGSPTSAEEVSVVDPAAGTYVVVVHGWQTDGADANYTLFDWAVGADTGNTTVTAPTEAVLGETGTVTLEWAGLTDGTKYLGAVAHHRGSDTGSTKPGRGRGGGPKPSEPTSERIALTIVGVDTD